MSATHTDAGTSRSTLTRHGYELGRQLTAAHGRTYRAAALVLPPSARRGVYALYGFARTVDDVVDTPRQVTRPDAAARLDRIEAQLWRILSGAGPDPDDGTRLTAILSALDDTVTRFDIPTETFGAFLHSMRMDVPGTTEFRRTYRSWDELAEYTYGSASVIGLQMLPLLGIRSPGEDIAAGAATLGEAFQLTNFLRDVAEDLDRDRIYLPTDELAAFGVDEEQLRWCREQRRTTGALRRALAHLIAVNRDQYRRAHPSMMLLPNRSRQCIVAAATTYHDILAEIEHSGYAVMDHRAVVGRSRRALRVVQALTGTGDNRW